jgi:hypothetical protein
VAELDSQSKPLQSIYGWFAQSRLHVNRRYQRKLVWTLTEKQQLVSSVFNGYPIPAVLLAERDDGYEIIDGLQRLFTLTSFVETSFPSSDGRFFNVDEFATAKNRREHGVFTTAANAPLIDASEVSRFLDYPLAVSIMRGASEDDIDEVFSRINTYGHRLSDQERRQAGVQGEFSDTVRTLASELRGDVSNDILTLSEMPQISIDLPKMRHGYTVQADQVFWVQHGILSAGNLRDSLDEQCIADVLASLVGGQIIERSKDALDRIYDREDSESDRIASGLDATGSTKIIDEFKYCVQEILRACDVEPKKPLSSILGVKNPFPSVFAVILIAFHESLIGDKKKIADVVGVRKALNGLYSRLETSRKSTQSNERRKNVDTVKGLLADSLVAGSLEHIYSNASVIDIEALIRRSEIETPRYELKQGMLDLSPTRTVNADVLERVVKTICGIANCGPESDGVILIGVTDKDSDVPKVKELDGISPRIVAGRSVVGVAREAKQLNESVEAYVGRWKTIIRNSELSSQLKGDVLASVDYNDYYGLGVLVLRVPRQNVASFLGDTLYVREGDETKKVESAPLIANVVGRFNK